MQGILYEEHSAWLFILVTIIMGGAAAWASGRAIALTWRPFWQLFPTLAFLGFAVRFIHFSCFGGTLLTVHFYLVDTAIVFHRKHGNWSNIDDHAWVNRVLKKN